MVIALYSLLLRLYPAEFRSEFSDEMAGVFREAQNVSRDKSLAGRVEFFLHELTGLLSGAIREHIHCLTGSDASALFPSRRVSMRSDYRFPRSTWILMTVILAGLVLAIEKARAIAASLPHSNPHLPPIQPAAFTFVAPLLTLFALVYILAIVAWGVLFAMRRSGLHRLADLNTEP